MPGVCRQAMPAGFKPAKRLCDHVEQRPEEPGHTTVWHSLSGSGFVAALKGRCCGSCFVLHGLNLCHLLP